MRARGVPGLWVPSARVFHYTMNERLERAFLRDYFLALGQAQARTGSGFLGKVATLGWPLVTSLTFTALGSAYAVASKVLGRLHHPKSVGCDLRVHQVRGASMEHRARRRR